MLGRWWQHLTTTPWALRRAFPPATLAAINAAIDESEAGHSAEIRVAVESGFDVAQLWREITPRARALEVFSALRIWDTAANTGVLIYVLLAEHDIEIVADRGFAAVIPADQLAAICADLQSAYARGEYRDGTVAAVRRLGELAAPHFPPGDRNPDELPNSPILL
jgi:uncharacterized membrane protein